MRLAVVNDLKIRKGSIPIGMLPFLGIFFPS